MFEAYFDYSGDPASTAILTLGGMVATRTRWLDFSQKWDAAMERGGAKGEILHMRELAHSRGQFEGWDIEAKRNLLRKLFPLIRSHATYAICPSLDVDAYDRIIRLSEPKAKEQWLAREFLLQVCLETIAKQLKPTPDKRVTVVFEQDSPNDPALMAYFYHLTGWKKWREVFPNIRFAPKGPPPLQAADLIAYANYRYSVAKLTGNLSIDEKGDLRSFLCAMVHEVRAARSHRAVAKFAYGLFNEALIREQRTSHVKAVKALPAGALEAAKSVYDAAHLEMQRVRNARARPRPRVARDR